MTEENNGKPRSEQPAYCLRNEPEPPEYEGLLIILPRRSVNGTERCTAVHLPSRVGYAWVQYANDPSHDILHITLAGRTRNSLTIKLTMPQMGQLQIIIINSFRYIEHRMQEE
jgi:hypothetical protein